MKKEWLPEPSGKTRILTVGAEDSQLHRHLSAQFAPVAQTAAPVGRSAIRIASYQTLLGEELKPAPRVEVKTVVSPIPVQASAITGRSGRVSDAPNRKGLRLLRAIPATSETMRAQSSAVSDRFMADRSVQAPTPAKFTPDMVRWLIRVVEVNHGRIQVFGAHAPELFRKVISKRIGTEVRAKDLAQAVVMSRGILQTNGTSVWLFTCGPRQNGEELRLAHRRSLADQIADLQSSKRMEAV